MKSNQIFRNAFLGFALASLLVNATPAFAKKDGGNTGGGGAVVVCRNSDSSIASVRLLDLYEAELKGTRILHSSAPAEEQIYSVTRKLSASLWTDIVHVIQSVREVWLAPKVSFNKQYDLGDDPVLIEDNCTVEWVAHYGDTQDTLMVVTKYYSLMGPTDRAALELHEAIYRLARIRDKAVDSQSVRKIVAELFSESPQTEVLKAALFKIDAKNWWDAMEVKKTSKTMEFTFEYSYDNDMANKQKAPYSTTIQMWCFDYTYGSDSSDRDEASIVAAVNLNKEKTISFTAPESCRFVRIASMKSDLPFNWTLKADGRLIRSGRNKSLLDTGLLLLSIVNPN